MYWFCTLVSFAVNIYFWMIFIRVILSWTQTNNYSPAVKFLYAATEPLLGPARRYLPFLQIGGIDFSPVVVILIIQMIPQIVCKFI